MRLVFFGTPTFAVPTLEALLASRHVVLGVVTQPDRPSGRGRHVAAPPVKVRAQAAGLTCWQPERLKDAQFLEQFGALGADLGVVAAYGKILPQVLIDLPRLGFVNVHASLLPKYRGASPIQHALMNGDPTTGVTIMRIVRALDAGGMFATAERPVAVDDNSADVEQDLSHIGAALMVETLEAIDSGRATETPQDDALATFAPRLTKDDGLIDWRLAASVLHNRVRGLWPWPHAHTTWDGRRVVVLKGRVSETCGVEPEVEPGTVMLAQSDRLIVATGQQGAFELLEVQPEGRRVMTARDFLAGHRITRGLRFGHAAS